MRRALTGEYLQKSERKHFRPTVGRHSQWGVVSRRIYRYIAAAAAIALLAVEVACVPVFAQTPQSAGEPTSSTWLQCGAMRAATLGGAELLGWADKLGTLEPGKLADIIAVTGDPLADVGILEKVRFVMKNGVVYPTAEPQL